MRTVIWAAAFALAATSAYASPSFGGTRLSSGKNENRQEAQSSDAISAAQKVIAFFVSLGQVTASPAPRLPDERPQTPRDVDCEKESSATVENPAAEKRKPAAPSELLFLAF